MAETNDGYKVIKAGIWYTIGNILVKGIAFLTIPVFSYLMSTDQYGIYNSYAAYLSLLAVIVSLGLPTSVRNVRYDLPEEEKSYHINSTILILLAFFAFFLAALCFHSSLEGLLGLSFPMILAVVVSSTCTAFQSYYNNILTIDYKYQQFLKLSFFYSVSSTALSILLILFVFPGQSSLGRVFGTMIPMTIIAIYVIFSIWRKGKVRLYKKYTTYGIRFGLPLIPNDLSSLILAQFDRIMILRTIGESESGLYSFAYNIAIIYQVITNSIENAWTPWMFAKIHEQDYEDVRKKIGIYAAVLTLGTAMLTLASPEVIMILSSKAYWDSRTAVVPIIFAMYFFALATIPVGIEFYHKKTTWISGCTFCTAVCNIVLNLIYIPRYGYQAAAYTTLACYFLYAVFHMIAAAKLEPIAMLKMPLVILAIAGMGLTAGVSIAALYRPLIRWTLELLLIAALLVFAVKYKEMLSQTVSRFLAARKKK